MRSMVGFAAATRLVGPRRGLARHSASGRIAMNKIARACSLILAALALCAHQAARAEVTRIEIASRADVLGGKPFGAAGPYEKIVGTVFFAVDPAHPANKT